jgi:hypothetical protein
MPTVAGVSELCRGLFDDASMFSPNAQYVRDAYLGYCRHQLASYGDAVAALTCQVRHLRHLDRLAAATRMNRLTVSVVVPDGPPAAAEALPTSLEHVEVAALEVSVASWSLPNAVRALAPLAQRVPVFLELDAAAVDATAAHRLSDAGIGLKFALGQTAVRGFVPEDVLARALVACGAEGLPFKSSAGLHRAVRHRDDDSHFQHHGYLNLALAARVAAGTGNAAATTEVLALTDAGTISAMLRALSPADVVAIRRLLTRVGSFDLAASVADLRRFHLLDEV